MVCRHCCCVRHLKLLFLQHFTEQLWPASLATVCENIQFLCCSGATSPAEDICPPGEEESVIMPGCLLETVGSVEEGAGVVSDVLKGQADVAGQSQDTRELEDVSMEDISVKPVSREQVEISEEEQRLQETSGGMIHEDEVTLEERMITDIQDRARELLESWSVLQEMFKIPKKERQAERREHEREADRGSSFNHSRDNTRDLRDELREMNNRRLSHNHQIPTYSRDKYHDPGAVRGYHHDPGAVRGGYSGGGGARKNLRLDERTGRLSRSRHLDREDRRMLFQAKVEEEQRQKVMRSAISARHNQCCRLLGLDPATTPMLPRYPEFYFSGGRWVPMPEPPHPVDPSWSTPVMAALPPEAFRPDDPPLPNPRSVYPPGCCPDPPADPVTVTVDQSETEAEIIAYYDKLYYGDNDTTNNSSPSPVRRTSLSSEPIR